MRFGRAMTTDRGRWAGIGASALVLLGLCVSWAVYEQRLYAGTPVTQAEYLGEHIEHTMVKTHRAWRFQFRVAGRKNPVVCKRRVETRRKGPYNRVVPILAPFPSCHAILLAHEYDAAAYAARPWYAALAILVTGLILGFAWQRLSRNTGPAGSGDTPADPASFAHS